MKSFDQRDSKALQSELKALESVSGMLSGLLIVLFIFGIYGLIATENKTVFISLLTVGFSCLAILFGLFKKMKNIKAVIRSREKSDAS
ncbi:MAG: hypothetical protein HC913_07055 [Microscillaceae bacterium]|nr:hypothetical protein [Microscillaceae bacterium]